MSATQVRSGRCCATGASAGGCTQLDLALEAGVSARHLSLRRDRALATERGDGAAPRRAARGPAARAQPAAARRRLRARVPASTTSTTRRWRPCATRSTAPRGHDPYPALVVDRAWEMIAANRAVALLTAAVAPHLLEPPVNVLRVSPPPRRRRAADRQPRRVARAPARAAAAADRADRRPGAGRAARGARGLSRRRPAPAPTTPARRSRCRCACARPTASSRSSARSPRSAPRSRSPPRELSIESFFPADDATAAAVRAHVERLPRT